MSATVLAPTAADADALATALYALGTAGLDRIAPAGGAVAAILVVPDPSRGGVRLVLANVDDADVAIDAPPGDAVVRHVPATPPA